MKLTDHAIARMKQRAIEPMLVELVCRYGHEERRHKATVYALDKKGRKRLRQECGRHCYKSLEDKLNIGVVVSDDGAVITAFHRTKRSFH